MESFVVAVRSEARVDAPKNLGFIRADAGSYQRVPVARIRSCSIVPRASVVHRGIGDIEQHLEPAIGELSVRMDAFGDVNGFANGRQRWECATSGGCVVGAGDRDGIASGTKPRRVEERAHDSGDIRSGSADDGGSTGLVEIGALGAGARRRVVPAAEGARSRMVDGDSGSEGGSSKDYYSGDGSVHGECCPIIRVDV